MIKVKKVQIALGYVMCMLALIVLVLGIIRIWIWFNANYAARTVKYQQSRLDAASPIWPSEDPYLDGSGKAPLKLTKEWVFKGEGESVGHYSPKINSEIMEIEGKDSEDFSREDVICGRVDYMKQEIANIEGQIDDVKEERDNCCGVWGLSNIVCGRKTCKALKNTVKSMGEAIKELEDTAVSLQKEAEIQCP